MPHRLALLPTTAMHTEETMQAVGKPVATGAPELPLGRNTGGLAHGPIVFAHILPVPHVVELYSRQPLCRRCNTDVGFPPHLTTTIHTIENMQMVGKQVAKGARELPLGRTTTLIQPTTFTHVQPVPLLNSSWCWFGLL